MYIWGPLNKQYVPYIYVHFIWLELVELLWMSDYSNENLENEIYRKKCLFVLTTYYLPHPYLFDSKLIDRNMLVSHFGVILIRKHDFFNLLEDTVSRNVLEQKSQDFLQ